MRLPDHDRADARQHRRGAVQGLALACAQSDEERHRMLRGIESPCLQDFARFDTANLMPIPFYRRWVLRRRGPL